jgi:predicted DNA-binding ribbon-helix-helix protein
MTHAQQMWKYIDMFAFNESKSILQLIKKLDETMLSIPVRNLFSFISQSYKSPLNHTDLSGLLSMIRLGLFDKNRQHNDDECVDIEIYIMSILDLMEKLESIYAPGKCS